MKKEKSTVAAEAKANLTSLGPGITKLEGDGGDLGSPPPIKQEPEGPPSVKTNSVNGENNCDTSTPATPTGAGGTEGAPGTPSSLEDMKPPGSTGAPTNPTNCASNGTQPPPATGIKSETESFLDTFDSKDGGEFPSVLRYIAGKHISSSLSGQFWAGGVGRAGGLPAQSHCCVISCTLQHSNLRHQTTKQQFDNYHQFIVLIFIRLLQTKIMTFSTLTFAFSNCSAHKAN